MSVRALRRGTIAAAREGGTPTTYTIFGDAADAYIGTAPGNADGIAGPGVGGAAIYVGQNTATTAYEGFIAFDTSAAAGTITAVTLYLYGTLDGSDTDFTIEARPYDWGAAVDAADWRSSATLGTLPLAASLSSAGWNAAGYNVLTSAAAFLANINQAGITRLVLCSSRHRLGIAASGAEYVGISSADVAGTTQDPKLVIEALV